MNTSVPFIIFLLSMSFTEVAEAQVSSENVSFSGSVVVPTCSVATPWVITDARGMRQASTDMAGTGNTCLEGSGVKQQVAVSFISTIRTLSNTERDSLLDYFVRRSKSHREDGRVSSKLVTLTYQ